mmetsp:Transcript_101467/g.284508  ORF Transcript_101467/g.284508 Transcript_101467/m.284508 type:complete len:329 (+) Transcript_101467:1198-2184(+)
MLREHDDGGLQLAHGLRRLHLGGRGGGRGEAALVQQAVAGLLREALRLGAGDEVEAQGPRPQRLELLFEAREAVLGALLTAPRARRELRHAPLELPEAALLIAPGHRLQGLRLEVREHPQLLAERVGDCAQLLLGANAALRELGHRLLELVPGHEVLLLHLGGHDCPDFVLQQIHDIQDLRPGNEVLWRLQPAATTSAIERHELRVLAVEVVLQELPPAAEPRLHRVKALAVRLGGGLEAHYGAPELCDADVHCGLPPLDRGDLRLDGVDEDVHEALALLLQLQDLPRQLLLEALQLPPSREPGRAGDGAAVGVAMGRGEAPLQGERR